MEKLGRDDNVSKYQEQRHLTFSGFVKGDQGVEDLGEVQSLKEVADLKRLKERNFKMK